MSDGSSASRRPPPPPSLAREERTPPTTLLKRLLADVAVANNNALAGPASDQLKLAECLHAVAWQSAETLIELGGLPCVIALVLLVFTNFEKAKKDAARDLASQEMGVA